jgi:hypothetical protein
MASNATMQKILPEHVLDDIIRYINCKYQNPLPNSLIIAQAFILQYPEYGREFGLPIINKAIEDCIKQDLF